jgi:hypothetical protein
MMPASKPNKCVMMALAPEAMPALAETLGKRYRLHWPSSVMQAQTLLDTVQVDLIVCGVLFDDSRLLDLLQYCKSNTRLASIPFVGVRMQRGRLPIDSFRDLMMASSALGAEAFVDLEQWEKSMGHDEAWHQLESLVDNLLA